MSHKRLYRLSTLTLAVALIFGILSSPLTAFGSTVSGPAVQAPAAWDGNAHLYSVGDLVTYQGNIYRCIQRHTSQLDWTPAAVASLWTLVGPAGGPTPTNTLPGPTATGTNAPPGPTPTPTNTPMGPTPTPTATTGGGAGCWAAWNATSIYTGGMQASRNGQNYQALFWNQNQDPALATNSGPAGSGKPWVIMGGCTVAPTATPTRTPTTGPTPTPCTNCTSGGRIMGYFVEWGIYARNYQPKNLVTSGSAAKITHINFAFGNVTNGQCAIGDAFADYDKFYDAASSVNGTSDTWDTGALRGIFHQFQELKTLYPNIKILWSFGGWTWSGGFAQAAANPTAFANSCYNLVHDPRWNGVFDGIDIDWEYPNACGLTCDASGSAAFGNLMSALRSRFGSELVTAAVTADPAKVDLANYAVAANSVDWFNVMTYDFFGSWAASGPTAPHSPLTCDAGLPTAGWCVQNAIAKYRSIGVPANKLLMGIGFYGRGWTGVTQSTPGGSATGAAPGTFEAGNEDYKVLVNTHPQTGTFAGTGYSFSGGQWWGYDTPSTIPGKMNWMKSQGLGGAFFWEFNGDTASGALLTAIYNNR